MGKKKPLTQKALATLGGKATLEKHGKAHYQKMILKRWHPKEYEKLYGNPKKKSAVK